MRKILFIILAALLVTACSTTPQKRAEKQVKSFLKKSVTDYKSVSFGVLDTIDIKSHPEYEIIKDSLRYYREQLREVGDQFQKARAQQGISRMKHYQRDIEDFYENSKFKIQHTYQATNRAGEQVDMNYEFYLGADYKVVN